MGWIKFTFNMVHFITIISGIAPQILRDPDTGKINVLKTSLFFLVPIYKIGTLVLKAINEFNALFTTKLAALTMTQNICYEVSGIMLLVLGIIRSARMHGIFTYLRSLLANNDRKPSWTFMLIWLIFFMLLIKYVEPILTAGVYKKDPSYRTFKGYYDRSPEGLRYLDMTMSLLFIGSSLYLYECGCKTVLSILNGGDVRNAMQLYTELVKHFAIFADAYKYEVVNIAVFQSIWMIEMTSQFLNNYMKYRFEIPQQLLVQIGAHFVPQTVLMMVRFVYVCVAASSLKIQKEEILEQLMLLKIKNHHNPSRKPRDLSYDEVDVWIEIVKDSNFDLSGIGIFVLDREFLSSMMQQILSFIILSWSSKHRSKDA